MNVSININMNKNCLYVGNKSIGGLVKVTNACGLVGFVKFLGSYYFTLITQKKKVGCIGANSIYSIKATEMFAVKPHEVQENNTLRQMWKKLNKKLNQTALEVAEARYMGLFQFVDLTKDFYFSYSYDLTHSLQHNFLMTEDKKKSYPPYPAQEMFEWNHFQTEEMRTLNGKMFVYVNLCVCMCRCVYFVQVCMCLCVCECVCTYVRMYVCGDLCLRACALFPSYFSLISYLPPCTLSISYFALPF